MSEKEEYMEMIGIPQTSTVTYKKIKAKRQSKKKDIKNEVIEKVNNEVKDVIEEALIKIDEANDAEKTSTVHLIQKSEKKHRASAIKIEVAVLVLLIASIFIANALIPNSGINTFVSNLIGQNDTSDSRLYTDFAPTVSGTIVEGGVIKIDANTSVYSPATGKIDSVTKESGGYTIKISHSEKFSSTISGLKFVYYEKGDSVVNNVPVGYAGDNNARLCFYGESGAIIVNFTLDGSSVVWAV